MKVAIIKNGIIVYRGILPSQWGHHCALRHIKDDWVSLNAKGIFELVEVIPEDVSATHKIDGFIDDIQVDKVVQTWLVREKTQVELDVEAEYAATEHIRQRQDAHLPIPEQLDMLYWDKINGTTAWIDYVTEIKERFPDPAL